jgi:hypothetical protein
MPNVCAIPYCIMMTHSLRQPRQIVIIDRQRARSEIGVIGRARPLPVRRRGNQLPPHRVAMDVIDFLPEFFRRENVAIITAAALPEAYVLVAIGLDIQHLREEIRGILQDKSACFACDGNLDFDKDIGDIINRLGRPNEQMNMLGHENVGEQAEGVNGLGAGDGVDEPLAWAIFAEKRLAVETRKGEVMGVAGRVDAAASFPDGDGFGNG